MGDAALFVACLALLIALHRIIGIKRLNRQMLEQQVDRQERAALLSDVKPYWSSGCSWPGLLATGAMMVLAASLATSDGLLPNKTSLAVAAIRRRGGRATHFDTLVVVSRLVERP